MARSRLDSQGETLPLEKRLVAFGNANLRGDFGNGRRVCRQLNFGNDEVLFKRENVPRSEFFRFGGDGKNGQ